MKQPSFAVDDAYRHLERELSSINEQIKKCRGDKTKRIELGQSRNSVRNRMLAWADRRNAGKSFAPLKVF